MAKIFKISLIFTVFLLISHTISSLHTSQFITIYVHGTTTALGLKLLSKFCKEVSFGEKGLHHIDDLPDCALLKKDAQLLEQLDPQRFSMQHFYTFCWSGTLSFKARKVAGQQLYDEIQILLQDYMKKYGIVPKVRILTFSHGGNVALNMVKLLPFSQVGHVHLELVLVACPVQKVTEKLIEHENIAQSYVISSTRDLLQIVDFYRHEKRGYYPERFFNTSQSNCRQIEVLINDRGLGHIDLMRSFMLHIPYTLQYADSWSLQQDDFIKKQHQGESDKFIIKCNIYDPKFRFYNLFNLPQVVRGQRKP